MHTCEHNHATPITHTHQHAHINKCDLKKFKTPKQIHSLRQVWTEGEGDGEEGEREQANEPQVLGSPDFTVPPFYLMSSLLWFSGLEYFLHVFSELI